MTHLAYRGILSHQEDLYLDPSFDTSYEDILRSFKPDQKDDPWEYNDIPIPIERDERFGKINKRKSSSRIFARSK